ncbi:MAG: hypothetical protein ACR2F2_00030 [Pyrinomonadaceae bacterium]
MLINIFIGFTVVFFGLPLWAFLILPPANVYLQIFPSPQLTFRDSLQLKDIPPTGYEKRLVELNGFEKKLQNLGFEKFDEFYLQTSNDIVGYAYKHRELPIVLCNYHLETRLHCDLDTGFDNGFALTTCNAKFSSVSEIRPPNLLLQAFPDAGLEELFNRHIQSVRFLQSQGFNILNTPIYGFREKFIQEFLEIGKKMKSLAAPVKILYLMYFGNKNKFTKTIQEQVLAKQLQLPS